MGMRTEQLPTRAVPRHKVCLLSKAKTSQNFQEGAMIRGIPIYDSPRWGTSAAWLPEDRHSVLPDHSFPSHVGAQTLVLLKSWVYLSVSEFLNCNTGKFLQLQSHSSRGCREGLIHLHSLCSLKRKQVLHMKPLLCHSLISDAPQN